LSSLALSSSFVILGASPDLSNIVHPSTIKKINRVAKSNLFIIPYLLDELRNFLKRKAKYILDLTDRYPEIKNKADKR
jgi:hypothetical protein